MHSMGSLVYWEELGLQFFLILLCDLDFNFIYSNNTACHLITPLSPHTPSPCCHPRTPASVSGRNPKCPDARSRNFLPGIDLDFRGAGKPLCCVRCRSCRSSRGGLDLVTHRWSAIPSFLLESLGGRCARGVTHAPWQLSTVA